MSAIDDSSTPEPIGRGERITLIVILAAALGLRMLYLSEISGHPLFTTLSGDPAVYFAQARDILAGSLVPPHAFFHSSPLYPFFLALISRLGGEGLQAIRVVQSFFGTLTVLLIFLLGRRAAGVRSGLVAAAFAALYSPFIFFEGEVLEITLVITFLSGSLLLLAASSRKVSLWRAVVAGGLLGMAGMGKPNVLLFAPVAALWLWLAGGKERPSGRSGPERGRALAASAFFLAAGLVVLPATIHNYRAEGDFIPVSSNGGINLFIGNHTGSPGVFQVPPDMRFDLRVASKQAAERATGRSLTSGEVSDYWTRQTLGQIAAAPGSWLALMGRKLVLFWNHYEIPNHYHLYYVREFAPVLRLPVATFGVVAPLGLLGIALAARRRKEARLLALFGVTFMVSVLPFFITGRYRLAVVIVLLVGTGAAVTEFLKLTRARAWKRLLVAAAVLAVLAVAVNVNTIEFGYAQMHNTVGAILGRRGDMEGAAAQFRLAVRENPSDLSARYNLGLALLRLGRYDEAADEFRRAVEEYPGYHEAWLDLGRALAAGGRGTEAAEAWRHVVDARPQAPQALVSEAMRLIAAEEDGEPDGR